MVGVGDSLGALEKVKGLLVADPSTLGDYSKLIQASGKLVCNAFSSAPEVPYGLGGGMGAILSEMCAPYFAANGYTPPSYGPPFVGGQCDGRLYSVNFYRKRNGFPQTIDSYGVYGPVLEAYVTQFQSGSTWFGFHYVRARSAPTADVQLFQFGQWSSPEQSYLSGVTTGDGLPDTCGNLPSVGTPGTAPVQNWNSTTNITGPNNSTVNVNIGSPSIIGVDVNIPVDVGGVTVNFGNNDGAGPYSDPTFPPTEGKPSTPGNAGDENEDSPPVDSNKKLSGVLVNVTVPNTSQTELFLGGDAVGEPGHGWIRFALADGSLSNPTPVIARNSFIPVPSDLRYTSIVGCRRAFVSWILTPVYYYQPE